MDDQYLFSQILLNIYKNPVLGKPLHKNSFFVSSGVHPSNVCWEHYKHPDYAGNELQSELNRWNSVFVLHCAPTSIIGDNISYFYSRIISLINEIRNRNFIRHEWHQNDCIYSLPLTGPHDYVLKRTYITSRHRLHFFNSHIMMSKNEDNSQFKLKWLRINLYSYLVLS